MSASEHQSDKRRRSGSSFPGRHRSSSGRFGHESLSFASFVLLGLPDGMIGVAWPAIRRSFHASIGELGLVLLLTTAGAALGASFTGGLLRRLGVALVLVMAGAFSCLGAFGVGMSPSLVFTIGVVGLIGAGSGLIDSGLNTVFGISGRQRLLNFLHGAYGIGTALGPLLVTAALLADNWRIAYGVLAAFEFAMAGAWALVALRDRREPGDFVPQAVGHSESASEGRANFRSLVAVSLFTFLVYTGLEVAAGEWEASFVRGSLHLSSAAAGLATFGYWGALTVARFALALPRRQVAAHVVVLAGCVGAVAATVVIWAGTFVPAILFGFVLLGAALGGIFPALVVLTPSRVGLLDAERVIGWQIGVAALGGSGISALIGLVIDLHGLSVLAPSLVGLSLVLGLANLVLSRLSRPYVL